ncbi:MAG: putative toxin-antitoxin system toxin component, PIN family [Treponema sp.]|jgi:putative PIN family toxin of toxin-antitoxin system|nr:putative toxin-antitoxin system toxin component, PIN family [Treponema sp.]
MKVVIDTNVIVSALLNINGTPAKLLSLILNGNVKILCDNRIIYEYIDVLSRKEFEFPKVLIDDLIGFFKREGEFVNSEYVKIKFSDDTDKKFYEVYKSGKAQFLVTGNIKHFPKEDTIIIPKDFMQIYET